MTKSIVRELAAWVRQESKYLADHGVAIESRFPRSETDDVPWKAGIGLSLGDLVVSYTVWEQTLLFTELIVENIKSQQTIAIVDREVGTAAAIHDELNRVVEDLIHNRYKSA
jgi:hypothetical protein